MLEVLLSPAAWLAALLIFLLRVADMALDTVRVLFVVRGKRKLAWILGFFQSMIFVIAITSVLADLLSNPLKVLGYAAGFATGNVIGMIIEERLAIGHIHISIISPSRGHAVAESIRSSGYAVTVVPAQGKSGMVSLLLVNVLRKDIDKIETIVLESDPEAFVTAEDVRPIRRGFWRA
jgi:uncharacterized protein YebE (UPF0316 family)